MTTVPPGDTPGSRGAGDWEVDVAAMAGSLVHEIKNPLSTLNLNAQLLLEDWKDATSPRDQRTVKRLRVIQSEIQRLERIIQTFLRFTERHELALQDRDLNEVLSELADFVAPDAERLGVQVRLGLDSELENFPFDMDLLRQVFLNLTQNALQAMEDSGGELILRTYRVVEDGRPWAVGEVTDTGRGMSERDLEKIFALYYSTKRNGTGLGLAISHRIVQEHGGRLEVKSASDKGSQFRVYLPMWIGRVRDPEVAGEA